MFGAVNQFKGSIANHFVGTKNVGSVVQVIHDITDLKIIRYENIINRRKKILLVKGSSIF